MLEIDEFTTMVKDIYRIGALESHLSWDHQTQMPAKGAAARAEMMAWLGREHHRRLVAPRMGELLDSLENQELTPDDGANVREMRRTYDLATKLSEDHVSHFSKACSEAFVVWQQARQDANLDSFIPHLEKLVTLTKEKIAMLGVKTTPYDVLLDEYEVGMTVADYDPLFARIRARLVPLLQRIRESDVVIPALPAGVTFTEKDQLLFCRKVVEKMGFDLDAGRIDKAAHPFCSGLWPGDTRFTTRFDEKDPFSCLYAVMHEAGHGLYEQGLDSNFAFTPRGNAISLGVHESQSRFWENQIGRTESFWKVARPWFNEIFPGVEALDEEQLNLLTNEVKADFIRVEADEITYNLHIMLRYEIEKMIFNEGLSVDKIEETWNRLFYEWFGIEVPSPDLGCIQDVHWAYGAFGYFPTYTLGNMYAAQFTEKMVESTGSIDEVVVSNDWSKMKDWLTENVHRHGSLYRPTDLLFSATGKAPNPEPFLKYIEEKFTRLYQLN
ncbi:MAG: carboxypeptidase M32 [Candidatus Poseidoniales archaeon]